MLTNHKKNDGVSLRTIHTWLIIGAAIACETIGAGSESRAGQS